MLSGHRSAYQKKLITIIMITWLSHGLETKRDAHELDPIRIRTLRAAYTVLQICYALSQCLFWRRHFDDARLTVFPSSDGFKLYTIVHRRREVNCRNLSPSRDCGCVVLWLLCFVFCGLQRDWHLAHQTASQHYLQSACG